MSKQTKLKLRFKPGRKINLLEYKVGASNPYDHIYFSTGGKVSYLFLNTYFFPKSAFGCGRIMYNNEPCYFISMKNTRDPTYVFLMRKVGNEDAVVLVKDDKTTFLNSNILITIKLDDVFKMKMDGIEISNHSEGEFSYLGKNDKYILPDIQYETQITSPPIEKVLDKFESKRKPVFVQPRQPPRQPPPHPPQAPQKYKSNYIIHGNTELRDDAKLFSPIVFDPPPFETRTETAVNFDSDSNSDEYKDRPPKIINGTLNFK